MAENSKELQKRQENELKKRLGDYLATFTSATGKRVLKDMRRSYCGHVFDPDPAVFACNVGKMEVVKDIEALLIAAKNPKAIEDLFRSPEDDGFDF